MQLEVALDDKENSRSESVIDVIGFVLHFYGEN